MTTPFEGAIVIVLFVVCFITGAEAVAIFLPTFLHKKIGDAKFTEVSNWGANM